MLETMASCRGTQFFSTLHLALSLWLMMEMVAETAAAGPVDNTAASHDRAGHFAIQHLPRLHKDADQGSPLAQYLLGALYQHGEIVPQDYAEALKWFRRAADQDLAIAQFALGEIYARGQGVPEDVVRAHMWLNLSVERSARMAGGTKVDA